MSAQATADASPARRATGYVDPLENLSLQETLRVMDVAREMRDQRETAEEVFRRDDLKSNLREKLLRQARLSGEDVSAAEIDAAISQYMESLHTYQDPPPGMSRFMAKCWIWRTRIAIGLGSAAAFVGAVWFLIA